MNIHELIEQAKNNPEDIRHQVKEYSKNDARKMLEEVIQVAPGPYRLIGWFYFLSDMETMRTYDPSKPLWFDNLYPLKTKFRRAYPKGRYNIVVQAGNSPVDTDNPILVIDTDWFDKAFN